MYVDVEINSCLWHTLQIYFFSPLVTVEIQMTHPNMIYHMGCLLKTKSNLMNLRSSFV